MYSCKVHMYTSLVQGAAIKYICIPALSNVQLYSTYVFLPCQRVRIHLRDTYTCIVYNCKVQIYLPNISVLSTVQYRYIYLIYLCCLQLYSTYICISTQSICVVYSTVKIYLHDLPVLSTVKYRYIYLI